MINLLIDIGNSNIKTALGSSSRIILFKRSDYDKKSFSNSFLRIIRNLKSDKNYRNCVSKIRSIGISLLDIKLRNNISRIIRNEFSGNTVFIDRNLKLPVLIDYSSGLGNDRIANASGAVINHEKENVLVIDFGTANTFTFIKRKKIAAGMIAPGIRASFESLIKNTSLPETSLKFPGKPLSNNTSGNIRSGIFFPPLFAAERIIQDLRKKYKGLYVISTGGYGRIFFKKSSLINEYDEKLSMRGINYILEMNS